MMDERLILEVEHLSKKFCGQFRKSLWYGIQDIGRELLLRNQSGAELRDSEFWAVRDVSFTLDRGEALGVIGRNGAGKTTLLRLLNGLIKPDRGRIMIRGKTAALIELGAGFDPVLTGRENIYVNGALLGMARKDMMRLLDDIIDFAELGEFIDTPLQNYSAGMRVRLGYSVAAHVRPELLIIDEVLAVGDIGFQRKCLQHAIQYLRSGGSLVLVSHNMHLVQSICQRCVFLEQGEIRYAGKTAEAIDGYVRSQNSGAARDSERARLKNADEASPLIEKIKITPLEGTAIVCGQGIRLVLYYDSPRNLSSVTWGFSFWTKDLQVRIATCLAKYANQKHCLGAGKGHFSCVIPRILLAPGVYAVRAGIYEVETAWPLSRIGWDDAATFFAIEGALDEQNARRSVDGDLMAIEVDWDE